MKAAVVESAGHAPVYKDFAEPQAETGEVAIDVMAAPLSQVTRARASGAHYSAANTFPFVPGIDGVGRRADGKLVYFVLPRAPFGGMAERTVARESFCVPLPDGIDAVTAAAMAIPAMSSWMGLKTQARLAAGEVVLINGATGTSGRLAVQIAKRLGAGKVIATGRNKDTLAALKTLGADVVLPLNDDGDALEADFARAIADGGVDVILDYLWGPSAERLLAAIAKSKNTGRAARFVQIGASGGATIELPYSVIRSYPLQMIGCGIGSVPYDVMLRSIAESLQAGANGGLVVETRAMPLVSIAEHWNDTSSTVRTVFVT
ncbi:MAG TPA: zinc-binding alcohol dehydrogenase family protein [Xanthobacteraceae bacterium]|jgi:NADPH2:quinone reductase|nr:zinc-binding alcohol dehydrogenase family protein [Xanthobacteraceae bacterium]